MFFCIKSVFMYQILYGDAREFSLTTLIGICGGGLGMVATIFGIFIKCKRIVLLAIMVLIVLSYAFVSY